MALKNTDFCIGCCFCFLERERGCGLSNRIPPPSHCLRSYLLQGYEAIPQQ